MTVLKKLVGQTAIYGLSSIVGRLLNFLLVPLYTSVFTTGEYGTLSVLMTVVAFSMVVLTFGFETAFFHYTNKEKNPSKVLSTAFVFLTSSALLFLAIVIPSADSIANILHVSEHTVFIKYLAWILVFDVITTLPFAKLRVDDKPWRFALIRIVNIIVNIGLNLFFFLLCPYLLSKGYAVDFVESFYKPEFGIGYIFIANLLASLTMLVLLLPEILKIKIAFDKSVFIRMWKYAFPILVGGLAYVTNEMVDKLLLEYLLPTSIASEQVGIYSACYKIAIFMTLFIQAFRYGAEPFFFAQAKHKDAKEQYANVMRYFIAFTSLIFLGINVFIDLLKHFLQNESYHQGLDVVPILLLANLFLGMYYNLSVWYKVTEKTKYGAYLSLAGALITISLNLLLIPSISYMGSAWATLACYASMCVMSYYFSRKHYPISYDWKRISFYMISAIGFYGLWVFWHDPYFIMSTLLCLLYIFAVVALEKRKKISTFKH